MPKWIHDRADHLRAKNPDMPESEAWAIATQQSHALGKSPKGYGTLGGRATAKAKFNTPKDDVKSANPGKLSPAKVAFGLSQYSGALNPDIRSGASDLPAFKAPQLQKAVQKVAASAPTRGNFMMASDIPSFRAPRLDVAIQKDGAFEDMKKGTEKDSDSIGLTTYSPGDFRQVNINAKHAGYFKLEGDAVIETDKHGKSLGKGPVTKEAMLSMSTEKLAEFVAELREMRKEAIAGLTPASQLEKTTLVGAPKASAPPGPSIADQVKPRGPKFGIGLPGAFKTGIG